MDRTMSDTDKDMLLRGSVYYTAATSPAVNKITKVTLLKKKKSNNDSQDKLKVHK